MMLAEDEPAIAELTRPLPHREGWIVFTVTDGEKAFEAFKAGLYNLVLVDAQMPGMDGLEATNCIREYERAKDSVFP